MGLLDAGGDGGRLSGDLLGNELLSGDLLGSGLPCGLFCAGHFNSVINGESPHCVYTCNYPIETNAEI